MANLAGRLNPVLRLRIPKQCTGCMDSCSPHLARMVADSVMVLVLKIPLIATCRVPNRTDKWFPTDADLLFYSVLLSTLLKHIRLLKVSSPNVGKKHKDIVLNAPTDEFPPKYFTS